MPLSSPPRRPHATANRAQFAVAARFSDSPSAASPP